MEKVGKQIITLHFQLSSPSSTFLPTILFYFRVSPCFVVFLSIYAKSFLLQSVKKTFDKGNAIK